MVNARATLYVDVEWQTETDENKEDMRFFKVTLRCRVVKFNRRHVQTGLRLYSTKVWVSDGPIEAE